LALEPAPFFVWRDFDYSLYGIAEFLNSQTQGSINILSQENGIARSPATSPGLAILGASVREVLFRTGYRLYPLKRKGGDSMIVIDIKSLYGDVAKLADIPAYIEKCLEMVSPGSEVTVTGQGPVWLYLKIGHALHGKVRRLIYTSPVTGEVEIFNHDPF